MPASERPYIGGSTDGTACDLIMGSNGLGRAFDGKGNDGGGGDGFSGSQQGNGKTGGTPPNGTGDNGRTGSTAVLTQAAAISPAARPATGS